MYSKIVMRGNDTWVAFLIVSRPSDDAILNDLRSRGWEGWPGKYGKARAHLNIAPGGLVLKSGDYIIINDSINPASPPDWSKIIDETGGCLVIVTTAVLDSTDKELVSAQVRALSGSPDAVSAHAMVTYYF